MRVRRNCLWRLTPPLSGGHPLSPGVVRVAAAGLAVAVTVVGAAAASRALVSTKREAPPDTVVAVRSSEVRRIAVAGRKRVAQHQQAAGLG